MKRNIITIILALVALTANGQKTVIEGTVLDAQGKTVDAYVTVAPKGTGYILGFADTDAKGHYKLEFTTQADSVTVTASGLAIGNQVKIVANRSQRVDFRVKEKTVQLKEVSVKASTSSMWRIWTCCKAATDSPPTTSMPATWPPCRCWRITSP